MYWICLVGQDFQLGVWPFKVSLSLLLGSLPSQKHVLWS